MNEELNMLIDELVSKGGPTVGQLKKDQDLDKVARLLELGWKPPEKVTVESRLARVESILIDHERRLTECSIRR